MITVKFFGGAKKSFQKDELQISKNTLTLDELKKFLIENKPKDTIELDLENILVAVNGIDSSALEKNSPQIKDGDVISIIPVIHGGLNTRYSLKILNSNIEIFRINKNHKFGVDFLEELRKKFPNLLIQGINSHFILSKSHLEKVLSLSINSKKNNSMLSKRLETDILMRFACSTQISQAINIAGIKLGTDFIIFGIGKKTDIQKLYEFLKPFLKNQLFDKKNSVYLQKQFNISNSQIKSTLSKSPLEDILVEKAAILI